jgi:hypothetical protein
LFAKKAFLGRPGKVLRVLLAVKTRRYLSNDAFQLVLVELDELAAVVGAPGHGVHAFGLAQGLALDTRRAAGAAIWGVQGQTCRWKLCPSLALVVGGERGGRGLQDAAGSGCGGHHGLGAGHHRLCEAVAVDQLAELLGALGRHRQLHIEWKKS